MLIQVKLSIPLCAYLRDPQETKLGAAIISSSIDLIDELGYEHFTFKKLALQIGSTEASIYRYFKNKQQLLLYVFSWYWAWMYFNIVQATQGEKDGYKKLCQAIHLLVKRSDNDSRFQFIDQKKLLRIIEREGTKSLLNKEVDLVNQTGAFENYKQVVCLLSEWILEANPTFAYPNMLVSTLIEGAHIQHFFSDHLPRLTNKTEMQDDVEFFFMSMLEKMILCQN